MSEDFKGVKNLEYAGANILEALVKIILNGEEVRLTGTMEDGQVLMRILDGTTHYWTNRTPGYPEGVDISGKVDKVTGKGLSTIDFTQTLLDLLNSKVTSTEGYSLVLNTLISQIHEPGSDNQDLTAIIASIEALNSLVTSLSPPYKIVLPSADTVTGRLVGLTEGVNYPTGWVLSADDKDLIVTHRLDNSVKDVVVWSKNTLESIERKELGNAAYSGLYYPLGATLDSVVIESLATVSSEITIYISFS